MGGVLGSLGINLPSFVAQLINFAILLVLLAFFGYKPIRRILDERSNRIKESMEKTEAIKEEYARAKEEAEKLIDKAREEGQSIISQAIKVEERLKMEAKEKAKQEAQAIINETHAALEREQGKIIADLRREFVDISILAAEKVIKETLDKERHRRLIEEALEEIGTLKKN
ncbi:MAG: ATP synthase F0 subunit B [Chloroflexi bacterium CG08_land_8_20_14_0_20_45_12]|nr:MAG: ATP synthase F0 subunit B [Dehalococcoidia bacterium CG2_30_46_9]PIU23899.1 MAG: ATP synthase F0 subunit B [Chloroflexi bacterium CG08_land_8_20_14_0_20_45_12]PIX27361.1 MAG: ATP synthase F0 subunit B [Chloroflexi bacterium CG_4_8_14_3_um_filter_45_15]